MKLTTLAQGLLLLSILSGCSSTDEIKQLKSIEAITQRAKTLKAHYVGQISYVDRIHRLVSYVLSKRKNDVEATVLLAWANTQRAQELETGEFDPELLEQSRQTLSKVLRANPRNLSALSEAVWIELYAKNASTAEPAFKRFMAQAKGNQSHQVKLTISNLSMLMGLYGYEVKPVGPQFQECVKLSKNTVEKWQCMETRARFHKLLKQYQEQLKIKQQMKDLFPQLPESWELLSLAYLDSGKPDEGIKHIEKALEMRRYQRALSHYNLAFYKKAEQLLQGPQKSHLRLVLKDVMELGFHHHKDVSRGMVITQKFLKNYSLTKDLLEKAQKDLPNDGKVKMLFGDYYFLRDDAAQALPFYKEALSPKLDASMDRLSKLNVHIRTSLIYLQLHLDDEVRTYKNAMPHVEQAMKLARQGDDNYGVARWYKAIALHQKGRAEKSKSDLLEAKTLFIQAKKFPTCDTLKINDSIRVLESDLKRISA